MACEPEKPKGLWERIYRFFKCGSDLPTRVEKMDQQHREVRHDLKNVQASADALYQLVLRMREDHSWQQPQSEGEDVRRDDEKPNHH
jgi:hypothetical protein